MIGKTLGQYQILGLLGKGGMGEVYRAHDSKLGRDVAIKLLPPHLTDDMERLARFEREAKVLATLNHPNIATIHGLEDYEGVPFLVMELVEGETLAERIAKGPVELEEALQICRQIAGGLEAAHASGIIHRDLKPANIKVTPEGRVVVLDFGLAKAYGQEESEDSAESPTITVEYTRPGTLLGTAAYMSPEQARGKPVDQRTDIWAFGCVLYEVLTGKSAFGGEHTTDVLASILRGEPNWESFPARLNPRLLELLGQCLEKDPGNRWHHVADLRLELGKVLADPEGAQAPTGHAPVTGRRVWVAATALALVTVLAVSGFFGSSRDAVIPEWASGPIPFEFNPPEGTTFHTGWEPTFAVSPNGLHLVFTARTATGQPLLWLKSIHANDAQPLLGTEGAMAPFWSPQSDEIGFFTNDALKRISVADRNISTITRLDYHVISMATWGAGGAIVFQTDSGHGLSKVSVQNESVFAVTTLIDGDTEHYWPLFLGDGRHFLFVRYRGEASTLEIGAVDEGGTRTLTTDGFVEGTLGYVPGYVLYELDGGLFARPFDEDALEFSGPPDRVLEQIPRWGPHSVPYSVSRNGVLAFWTQRGGQLGQFVWSNQDGSFSETGVDTATYHGWDYASRENLLVFSRSRDDGKRNIFIRPLERGAEQPITNDGNSFVPIFSPDAKHVAFTSASQTGMELFTLELSTQDPEPLTSISGLPTAQSWVLEPNEIVYFRADSESQDLRRWSLADKTDNLLVDGAFRGSVSPDGKWIAYVSRRERDEVSVAPYPDGKPGWQVSVEGGSQPEWRADSKELYYLSSDRKVMVVEVTENFPAETIPTERVALPPGIVYFGKSYEPDTEGERFLILKRAENPDIPPIEIILNWPAIIDG